MSASDAHITPGVKCGVKWCGRLSHITPGVAGCQVEIQYQPHQRCSDTHLVVGELNLVKKIDLESNHH